MNTAHRIIGMRKFLNSWVLLLLAGIGVAGCGQKGPLFLPGDPSTIYSAPSQQATQQADDVDEDDEDETPNTIQD
jgi:predicted small lipoprotein YifL